MLDKSCSLDIVWWWHHVTKVSTWTVANAYI